MSAHTLLVVDGDPAVHELLAGVLRGPEWEVDLAADGLAALARVQARLYDVVLAAVGAPEVGGLDLLPRILEIRPEAKVILMDAASTPATVVRAIRGQAFGYICKPFSPAFGADMMALAVNPGSWRDDIEVLSATPEWLALRLRCKMETADRLVQFVRELQTDLPPRERDNLASALRELLMNAIEHGGHSNPEKRVQVTYVRTARSITYWIQDPGNGFSMETIAHAAIANPPGEPAKHLEIRAEQGVRPGGFGILLTRNLVDELIYNEKGNEVLLIKYLK